MGLNTLWIFKRFIRIGRLAEGNRRKLASPLFDSTFYCQVRKLSSITMKTFLMLLSLLTSDVISFALRAKGCGESGVYATVGLLLPWEGKRD